MLPYQAPLCVCVWGGVHTCVQVIMLLLSSSPETGPQNLELGSQLVSTSEPSVSAPYSAGITDMELAMPGFLKKCIIIY